MSCNVRDTKERVPTSQQRSREVNWQVFRDAVGKGPG